MNRPAVHNLSSVASYIVIAILVFTSVRGWVVLNLEMPAQIVYGFSSVLIVILAAYGFASRVSFKSSRSISLRNYFLINLLLGTVFSISEYMFGGNIDISLSYIFLLPYIVFLFLRVSTAGLLFGFHIIAFGIAFSVLSNFTYSLSGADGVQYLIEYNTKLRPDVFEALSRTGPEFYRVGGYTGSYHDSANILGMLGVFYYVSYLIEKSLTRLLFAVLVLVAMTFTQSAANIILGLSTCVLLTLYLVISRRQATDFIFLSAFVTIAVFIVAFIPEVLVFTDRLEGEGYEGMLNMLTIDGVLSPHFWVGHGYVFNSKFIVSEIGFIKGVFQLGIFHAALIYWILIYPLYVFLKNQSHQSEALPYLAAVLFGFLSLLHYGSIFRITNIALFYAMYALFLRHSITHQNI